MTTTAPSHVADDDASGSTAEPVPPAPAAAQHPPREAGGWIERHGRSFLAGVTALSFVLNAWGLEANGLGTAVLGESLEVLPDGDGRHAEVGHELGHACPTAILDEFGDALSPFDDEDPIACAATTLGRCVRLAATGVYCHLTLQ